MPIEKAKTTPNAIKYAEKNWHNFVKASTYCGIAIAIILLIMAVTLV